MAEMRCPECGVPEAYQHKRNCSRIGVYLGYPGDLSKKIPDADILGLRPDEPIFVTATEGGTWVPWAEWQKLKVPDHKGKRVHSIMFKDGQVWDAFNGWRPEGMRYAPETIRQLYKTWDKFAAARQLITTMREEPEIFGDIL